MYYSRKKALDELPLVETAVWICVKEDCKGWMRDDFTFADQPICPHCQSAMIRGVKNLPALLNTKPS